MHPTAQQSYGTGLPIYCFKVMALIPSVLSSTPPVNLNVRRSVNLNFFPPSTTSRSDFWSGTGNSGGLMMARSLLWTSKKSSGTIKVYLAHASGTGTWFTSDAVVNISNYVAASLPGVTMNITVDYQGTNVSTLTLSNYDTCLISADGGLSVGSQVNSFCAAGGGLVLTTFANASVNVGIDYATYTPLASFPGNQSLGSTSMNTSTIVTHPVTTGLSSLAFASGSSGYGASSPSILASAQRLVDYANGSSLIAVREVAL